MTQDPVSRQPRRTTWLALAAVAWIVASLVLPATWIEHAYSRGLFPWIAAVLVPITGAIGLSLTGCAICVLAIVLPVRSVRSWRRRRDAGESRGRRLRRLAAGFAWFALIVYSWFLLTWGLGYRRVAIEDRLGLGDAGVTALDIRELTERITAVIVRDLPDPDDRDDERALDAICLSMRRVVRRWDGFEPELPTHVKRPPAGILLVSGTVGAISPWLLEAHVDGAVPPTSALGVAAHELGHVAGYCGEADADLVGFAAGLEAPDAFARYATALAVLQDLSRALPAEAWAATVGQLPAPARADLFELSEVVQEYRLPLLSDLRSSVYESYLLSHGVTEGMEDYARGVFLLVRAWRQGRVRIP